MPVISLFSGSYCNGEQVAQKVVETLGYRMISDQDLITETGKRYGIEESKLVKALTGKASIFNKFTHERERALACLKVTLADLLREQNELLMYGFAGQMIPKEISHVLKVCVIAEIKYRASLAGRVDGVSEKDAVKRVHKEDESRVLWSEYLFDKKDPWAPELYDIVVPMHKETVDGAARLICENARKAVLSATDASCKAVDDFVLAAQVDLKLAQEGHNVTVSAKDGNVTLTINKKVLMLSSLEEELKRTAASVAGVRSVETRVGPGYYQTDIYRKFDFDVALPSKVLLVDDEREFVQTLSERLQMRQLESAVVYDGEAALSVVDEDEPEVMVLDLKMPGVDGLEVLRRVKRDHPNVEVIVLTGHGSEEVEKLCMEMGACAYLEKPVEIETLTKTMQDAYQRMREKKRS